MLASANPDTAKGSDYSVRQMLDDYADRLGEKLADQPEAEATLQSTVGNAYWRLGSPDKGVKHLQRSLELRGRIFGKEHEIYANTLVDYAWALNERQHYVQTKGQAGDGQAEAQVREALRIYRMRGIGGQPVIRALHTLQVILLGTSRLDEIEPVVKEALAEAAKTPGVEYPEIAGIYGGLIFAKVDRSEFAEAERLGRLSVAMHLRLQGPDHPETGWGYEGLGFALFCAGHDFVGALQADEQALAIFRKDFPSDHFYIGYVLGQITDTLSAAVAASNVSEAFPSAEKVNELESIFHQFAQAKPSRPDDADDPAVAAVAGLAEFPAVYIELGKELAAAGKTAEADQCRLKAGSLILSVETEVANDPHAAPAVLRSVATALHSLGTDRDVEKLYEQVIALRRQSLGESDPIMGEFHYDFAEFLWHQENRPQAATEQYIDSFPARCTKQDETHALTLRSLGVALFYAGRLQEADPYLREALALYVKIHRTDDLGITIFYMVAALNQLGKLREAEEVCRETLQTCAKMEGAASGEAYNRVLAWVDCNLIRLYSDNGHVAELRDTAGALANLPTNNSDAFNSAASTLVTPPNPAVCNPDLAVRLAEKAVQFSPQNGDYWHTLGTARYRAGDFQGAIVDLEKSILLKGGDASDFCFLAMSHWKLGDAERSRQYFQQAVVWMVQHGAYGSELDETIDVLGTDWAIGAYRQIIENYRHAKDKDPRALFGTLMSFGGALYYHQRYGDAEAMYREAMQLRPSIGEESVDPEWVIEHQLGAMLSLQKKFPEAEQMLQRATQSEKADNRVNDFDRANTQSWLGGAIAGQGRYAEAEPILLDAYERLKVAPDEVWAPRKRRAIGRIINFYESTGKHEKANEWRAKLPTTLPTTAP